MTIKYQNQMVQELINLTQEFTKDSNPKNLAKIINQISIIVMILDIDMKEVESWRDRLVEIG